MWLQAGLALEWVYGYNASNTAPNAFYTSQQKIVYYVAALGVVYDPATHTQQFFQVRGATACSAEQKLELHLAESDAEYLKYSLRSYISCPTSSVGLQCCSWQHGDAILGDCLCSAT